MTDYKPQFPEIFPESEIKVKDEEHRYETFEGDSFDPVIEEKEYTLDKAPVDAIVEVTGILSGATYEFEQGSDYVLSDNNEDIVWQDDGNRPDAGSKFYVTYRCDSILSRYIESSGDELDKVDDELQELIKSKFVDHAAGNDLDEIGKLFGFLGGRNGRTDKQYRIYLKSVVQSFVSRGTVNGIKLAISAATDVPVDDISINENFQDNEYEIVVIPNNDVTGSVIEQVAEIADPSGVYLSVTRFLIDEDIVTIDDSSSRKVSKKEEEEMFVTDSFNTTSRTRFETILLEDDNNTNENKFLSSDQSSSDDAVTKTKEESVYWDENDWNSFNWAAEHN